MSLQISKYQNKEDARGWVKVEGENVYVEFHFGYQNMGSGTLEEAEAQARLFVMAMEGARMVDKLRAVQASLSETIARLEGRA